MGAPLAIAYVYYFFLAALRATLFAVTCAEALPRGLRRIRPPSPAPDRLAEPT